MYVEQRGADGLFRHKKYLKNHEASYYADDLEFKMSLHRILLVEDDFDDQFLAKKKLMQSKYVGDVVCFSNGRELVEYLHEHVAQNPDFLRMIPLLIVLDLDMPLFNGFEVLHEIKSDPLFQKIPVAVVSGTDSRVAVEKAFSLGAACVFRKPLHVNQLNVFFRKHDHGWPWEAQFWKKIGEYLYKHW